MGRIKLGGGGVTRLGGIRLVGSFGEVHAGGIKLWGIRLERRVNQSIRPCGNKLRGSSLGDQAEGSSWEGNQVWKGSGLRGSGLGRSRWERMRLEGIRLREWGDEAKRESLAETRLAEAGGGCADAGLSRALR